MLGYSLHLVPRERREDNYLVYTVAELGREAVLGCLDHLALDLRLFDVRLGAESERLHIFLEVIATQIRSHDNNGVREIDLLAATIRDPTLVKCL